MISSVSGLAGVVMATLTASLGLAACGASSRPVPAAQSRALTVNISDYTYHPSTLTISAGTRVSFTNRDADAHTATASAPALDTGTLKPGQSATITLTARGTYSYICQFHPFMHGILRVT
jgi:plastocyanin